MAMTMASRSGGRGGPPSATVGARVQFSEMAKFVGLSMRKTGPSASQRYQTGSFSEFGGTHRDFAATASSPCLSTADNGPFLALPPNGMSPAPPSEYDGFGVEAEPVVVELADASLSLTPPPVKLTKTSSTRSPSARDASALPSLSANRSENLKNQIDFLRTEKVAKRDAMRRMEKAVSDAMLLEEKARKRTEANRERLAFHKQRTDALDEQIRLLSEALNEQEFAATASLDGHGQERSHSSGAGFSYTAPGFFPRAEADEGWSMHGLEHSRSPPSKPSRRGARAAEGVRRGGRRSKDAEASEAAAPQSEGLAAAPGSAAEAPGSEHEELRAEGAELALAQDAVNITSPTTQSVSFDDAALALGIDDMTEESVEPAQPTPAEQAEMNRNNIRQKLIEKAGAARKAFRSIDLNGSGNISSQEFLDGLHSLGIDWQALTNLKRDRDIFKLFADLKDNYNGTPKVGVITFRKLFPVEAFEEEQPKDLSVQEFWKIWCKRNPDSDFVKRPAGWSPSGPEGELEVLFAYQKNRDNVAERRRWISASFKRLKNKGKSDAKARECVAVHLPKGSGPRDRDSCPTFSPAEVRSCRKAYTDSVMEPVKSVQKVVYDLREQRRTLTQYRQQLYQVSMAPMLMMKAEEDRKAAASSFAGLAFLSKGSGLPTPAAGKDDGKKAQVPAGPKTLKEIAETIRMDESSVQKLATEFSKNADKKTELLGKKGFQRLVKDICKSRTLADADMEAWWALTKRLSHSGDPGEARADIKYRSHVCNFEQFVTWFADSELRTS
eukprot:TRINITY_DN14095_c0_g1_i1.p1 TRINITY_DN14095_c0_g1~~TRINITY_DN14095_c0_g1_i1.p1  ORF type:complete len:782 (-),score=162.95 TRINITY_DN14095_c0_g1_i1:234-2579(-)